MKIISIIITALFTLSPLNSIAHEYGSSCIDFLIGNGEVRMDWQGVNPGSPKHTNAQARFFISNSTSAGVAKISGFFQAKDSLKWELASGEINGSTFSFTTKKLARDNSAGLRGGGTCSDKGAKGKFSYYGDGPGYSFTFKMYKGK